MYYDNITLNLDDADVEEQLTKMSMSVFQLDSHPVYFRNSVGQLVPAKPFSSQAGYKRNPQRWHRLEKL